MAKAAAAVAVAIAVAVAVAVPSTAAATRSWAASRGGTPWREPPPLAGAAGWVMASSMPPLVTASPLPPALPPLLLLRSLWPRRCQRSGA